MKKIGFACESLVGISLQDQVAQLKTAGCHYVYKQKNVSKSFDLMASVDQSLSPGDVFIVAHLSCLNINLKMLRSMFQLFQTRQYFFMSLNENIDTRLVPLNDLMMLMDSFICMEQQFSSRRTHEGLAEARLEGRVGGRPELHSIDVKEQAYQLYLKKDVPATVIAKDFGMSRATFYRYIEKKKIMCDIEMLN